jgi:hypothetical protein
MSPTNEWLAEFERITTSKGGATHGLSVAEMAEATGHSQKWVLANLQGLRERIVVEHRRSTHIDGKSGITPVYSLRKAAKRR